MTNTNSQAEPEPDWLKNHKADASTNTQKGWYKGMPSPNKSGRPKGIKDRRIKINEALLDAGNKIAEVIVDKALAGDTQAAALVLNRITPVLRAQAEKVIFEFDAKAGLGSQVEQVLQAISNGEVAVDTGKQIIESISALAGIKQIDELEARLNALEGK